MNQEITNYESLHQSNLDYNITEKEILEASRKLKNNKSSAHDMLKNEMIKTALPFLCKHIRQAFDDVLNSGTFYIALYNKEIYAGYKTCYQNKSLDEMFDMSFKCNNEFDKKKLPDSPNMF